MAAFQLNFAADALFFMLERDWAQDPLVPPSVLATGTLDGDPHTKPSPDVAAVLCTMLLDVEACAVAFLDYYELNVVTQDSGGNGDGNDDNNNEPQHGTVQQALMAAQLLRCLLADTDPHMSPVVAAWYASHGRSVGELCRINAYLPMVVRFVKTRARMATVADTTTLQVVAPGTLLLAVGDDPTPATTPAQYRDASRRQVWIAGIRAAFS